MKWIISLALVCVLAAIVTSCNGGSNRAEQVLDTKEVALDKLEDYTPADTVVQNAPPPAPSPKQQATSLVQTEWDKKIVKTATLQAEVKDFSLFSKGLAQKVKDLGGYISSEQQNRTEYRLENAVIIKVPVASFDGAVETILKDVSGLDTRQISSEDVSREYVDSKSRLEAKKQVRQRYLELLKGARTMSDVLEVQKEINSIQEEMELVSGRINYLGHAADLSTIQLTYYQVLQAVPSDKGVPGYLTQLKDSFANGWYWLGELLLGLVAIWPLVLLIAVVALLIRKRQVLRAR